MVKIGGTFTPTRLKVSLTNCYKLQTAPKNGVKLIVTNDGKEKETSVAYSAEGKYALNLPMDEGEKLSITSIVLIDAETIIAALKGHVGTPTKPTGGIADPHVYCGLPAIDSLDT